MAHATERQAADVGGGVEIGDERLKRMLGIVHRGGDVLQQQVHQRSEVGADGALLQRRPAGASVGVDDRELDLALVGVEVQKQLVDLVDDLPDPRVRAVDLVDHEDHRELRVECLAQHEARLRERALACVNEQQHAVDHRQAALDLAAEVGVPGGVDDVQLHPAVAHRGVLGEDRDALLALQIHRVHDPGCDLLVGAKRAGLPEHRVDQCRLAVVDVGDDGNVADVCAGNQHH